MAKKEVSKILDRSGDFQEGYREWKAEINNIIENNKITVKNKNPRRTIRNLIKEKKRLKKEAKNSKKKSRETMIAAIRQIEKDMETERKSQFRNKISKVVDKLKSNKGINGPNMWEVLRKVKKKKDVPASAVKGKDGKTVLEEPEDIKARYLEYFEELLEPVKAKNEGEKRQEEIVDTAFKKVMEQAAAQEIRYTTYGEIRTGIKSLKRRKCKDGSGWNNEVILNGGEEMIKSLKKIFNEIETLRMVPEQWNEVIVKAINKPGSVLEMENKRGLFLTDVISKLYEKILKNRNQEPIQQYISPNQAGGAKGKTTIDHIMVLCETIRRNRKAGKKTYVVFGDAVKCFDKLWLKSCLLEMYKAGCDLQDLQIMYKLNEETEIIVDTPLGKTGKKKVGEIVKQGTVLGPDLCCIETDQINNIGENQNKSVGEQVVGILVFVDDVMSAGTAEDIRKAIRNFAEMEKIKKFTYGLKKTKYMVMKTGREKEESIEERVKEGKVEKVDEYKYVGVMLSEEGDLLHHLDYKLKKMKGQVAEMKSMASFYNLGPLFVAVRLQLYEACIVMSILYNIEGWTNLSKNELQRLESIQLNALCTLLHLPKTSPYLALLNELGMWRMEERLMYRKIMLYHNVINSADSRLIKNMVAEQERERENGSWYMGVENYLQLLNIKVEVVKGSSKDVLRKIVKEKIVNRMRAVMITSKRKFKKMRFLNCENFQLKNYIKFGRGNDVLKALKTRLNMREIYGNYKGDHTLPRMCPYCDEEEDTTEHLIECLVFGETLLTRSDLANDENIEIWRQINEKVAVNMKWRDG